MWLTQEERVTLTVLGILALAGLGALLWQQQRPSLSVAGKPTAAQAARWDDELLFARQVDINAASAAELERLPEIGPALARRIVAHRQTHGPFMSMAELTQISGIGPKTLVALHDYVTVAEMSREK
jgi:competence protein ComEA